jgi:hypothetical protein
MKKKRKKLSFEFNQFRIKEFRILFFLIILITVLTFIGYIFKDVASNPVDQEDTFLIIRSVAGTTVELIEPGKTPLNILMEMHVTRLEQWPNELLIKCINNVCGGENYNWRYYINGESGDIGIEEYIIQEGDNIEFRLIGTENSIEVTMDKKGSLTLTYS